MTQPKIQGSYTFSRQEMVAGFVFSADTTFEFFYSYGAVDRLASGTFSIKGDILTLQSSKEAGHDFTVKSQSKGDEGYTVRIEDANKYLLRHIRCSFFIGKERYDEVTNEKGEIKVAFEHVDKIYVQHLLFPDIVTLVKDEQNPNKKFVLTLNPSLAQVSFKGIDFTIVDSNAIRCIPNYFMMVDDILFTKQEEETDFAERN
ncbi:MAG: hypothetical protein INR73_00190 [Williamsia sp.]|nr:hypothetical protein [Williamsia sp.]